MANFTDVDDLRQEGLDGAGEDGSDSTGRLYARALTYLNQAYQMLWFRRPWRFARASTPGAFSSVAPISGITCAITEGSTAGTFSESQSADLAGRKILINQNLYRLVSTSGGGSTTMTLDEAFREDTVTAGAVVVFQDEYDISGITRMAYPVYIRDGVDGRRIDFTDEDDPDIQSNLANPNEGLATKFTLRDEVTVIFDQYSQDARRFEVEYVEYPADLTLAGSVDWPRWARWILAVKLSALLLVDKNDDRALTKDRMAETGLAQLEEQEAWFGKTTHVPSDRNPYLSHTSR